MNTKTKTPGQICYEACIAARTDINIHEPWELKAGIVKQSFEAAATAVLASQWRPVTEPPQTNLKRVLLGGGHPEQIDFFDGRSYVRTHWMPIPPLPQLPVDPYAELRKAKESGKVIQETSHEGHWYDSTNPMWNLPVEYYRIKPWELTRTIPGFRPLEDGEQWHRNDFTEEMLPEGWRPALLNEVFERNGDCDYMNYDGAFEITMGTAYKDCNHTRTSRPLPPTKQELERKEFEDWAFNTGYAFADEGLRQWMFVGWQAARKQIKKA